jgi:hypothetical protein
VPARPGVCGSCHRWRAEQGLELSADEVERLVALAEHTSNQLVDWRPTQSGLANRQPRIQRTRCWPSLSGGSSS